jgi:hypothetical protein
MVYYGLGAAFEPISCRHCIAGKIRTFKMIDNKTVVIVSRGGSRPGGPTPCIDYVCIFGKVSLKAGLIVQTIMGLVIPLYL